MSTMTDLAQAIIAAKAQIDFDCDLPTPNLYFSSVYRATAEQYHVYIAADYTGSALQKLHNWCASQHNFRPYRSDSNVKFRRLKLGDLIENPEAYDKALALAKLSGESDIVKRLEQLPHAIAAMVGVPVPNHIDAKGLCSRMKAELLALDRLQGLVLAKG